MPTSTTKSPQITKRGREFLTAAERLAAAATGLADLHKIRHAAVNHHRELVALREPLATIEDDVGQATIAIVVTERAIDEAEQQRADALAACDEAEPPKHT